MSVPIRAERRRTLTASSATARILAEVAPHTPPLECCRAALIDGMRLAGGGEIVTARLVAARAALQVLHGGGLVAHVERSAAARGAYYQVTAPADATAAASDRNCCARVRLRGAFLVAGRVNRPGVAAHLEIDCRTEAGARRLLAVAESLDLPGQLAFRRGHFLALWRASESVAALLSSIGAQGGRLSFEEGRVVREVRGTVNRLLNAETANLRRRVAAAMQQLRAIDWLHRDPARWEALPPALREAGDLRVRWPDESLDRMAAEAGCSRSAMADRLRRLLARAEG